MEETLNLKWGNSFIKIENGTMEIKHKASFFLDGILGGKSTNEIIKDKIENFSLVYFKITMKRNVNIVLNHKNSDKKYIIEALVREEEVLNYIKFRDIMNSLGLYENVSTMDVLNGKDNTRRNEGYMNGTKEDFHQRIKKLPGFHEFGTKKEILHLREILTENEEVFAATSGMMNGKTWLITCTSKRIIFIDKGMIYGVEHSEVMIEKVNAISFKNGMVLGEIYVEDGASTRVIKNVPKYSTKPFVDAVHKAMDLLNDENKISIQEKSESPAEQLLKFKQLLDVGAITQEEFERQKSKLLS